MGHKVGFYCSEESGYSASDLTIAEGTPGAGACPLPFTQEQLSETLSRIICAAPDDFIDMVGEKKSSTLGIDIWETKNIDLSGSKDMFLSKDYKSDSKKEGKDFIIMFQCSSAEDRDMGLRFFYQYMNAIKEVKPSCGTLQIRDVEENLANFLVRSVIWDIEIKTPSGKKDVIVELDFNKFETGYFNNLHVNVKKQDNLTHQHGSPD